MALVQKADFGSFVQWTNNIPDDLIDFHIKKVEEVDLPNLIEEEMTSALLELDEVDSPELFEFFTKYVKPVIILRSASRFLVQHGVNVTQFGLTVPTDPRQTFTPASKGSRSDMKDQVDGDRRIYETRMFKELARVNWTLDDIQFDSPTGRRSSSRFKISGI